MASNDPIQNSQWRGWGTLVVGIATSALFLWLALRKVNLQEVILATTRASVAILLITQLTKFVAFALLALRSHLMLNSLHSYSFACLLKSVFIAFIGNTVMPLRLGEILRAGYLARHGSLAVTTTLAVVAFERILDLLCALLILAAVLFIGVIQVPIVGSTYVVASIIVAVLGFAIAVSRKPQAAEDVCRRITLPFGKRFADIVSKKVYLASTGMHALASLRTTIYVLLITLAYWATLAFTLQVWCWGFRLNLPWHAPIVLLLFLTIGVVLPSTPAQVGTYHYFGIAGLMIYGVAKSKAAAVVVVGHALAIVPFAIVGIVILAVDAFLRGESRLTQAK